MLFLLDGIPSEIWLQHIFPYLIGSWMSVSKNYLSLAVTTAFSSPRVSRHKMLVVYQAIIELDDEELLKRAMKGPSFEDVSEDEFNSGVFIAASSNSYKCMPLLLQHKKLSIYQHRSICEAAQFGNIQILRQLLAQPGLNYHSSVALFKAARCDQLEAIKVLLEDHRDLNEHESTFLSMLCEAVSAGYIEIMEFLLNSNYLTYIESAVYAAINFFRADLVERLFQDPRVSLSPDMLLHAVTEDADEIVELFLNYGIMPTEVDLKEAISSNAAGSLRVLLEDGRADPTMNNFELLREAIDGRNKQIIDLLLADPRMEIEHLNQDLIELINNM